jgi:type II secretion system protein G
MGMEQRFFFSDRAAFTLIELLIVVAIIAILAAIAVPNFLEAQTRAKVARVKADFRSVGTALEAYRVDTNTYPDPHWGGGTMTSFRGLIWLTTPVAYMTSIPQDPFMNQFLSGTHSRPIEYGAGVAGVAAGDHTSASNNIWLLESEGPDRMDNVATSPFPWPGMQSPPAANLGDHIAVPTFIDLVYDTMNGTRSQGNIFRTGGVMPPEENIHAFCIAVSR